MTLALQLMELRQSQCEWFQSLNASLTEERDSRVQDENVDTHN